MRLVVTDDHGGFVSKVNITRIIYGVAESGLSFAVECGKTLHLLMETRPTLWVVTANEEE